MAMGRNSPNLFEAMMRYQDSSGPNSYMPNFDVSGQYETPGIDPSQIDPVALQQEARAIQQKQRMAEAMMQQGYIPNSGAAGILSQVLGAVVGSKMQRQGDEKLSDLVGRYGEYRKQSEAAKFEQERQAEEAKFQRDLERDRKRIETEAANRAPEKLGFQERAFSSLPPELQGKAVQGMFGLLPKDRAPSAASEEIATLRAMGATDEQIRAKLLGQNTRAPAVPSGFRETETGLEFIPGGPADPNMKVSPTTVQNVKTKLQAINNLQTQLSQVKSKFGDVKGVAAGPFGQGLLPTEAGDQFDKAVAMLAPGIRQLTRTPGEGAMSDYESRLAQALLPNRTNYEATTETNMADLEAMIAALKAGYEGMLPQAGGMPAPVAGAATQEAGTKKRLKFNPATGDFE